MVPKNIHITPPTEGIGNSREEGGGGGVSKRQKFKAMYEAKLEFLEGWGGGYRANPFHGGYGYFLESHINLNSAKIFLLNFITNTQQ